MPGQGNAPRIDAIFARAREITDPAQWAGYLDEACGGDTALRAEIESLLVAEQEAGGFLEGKTLAMPDTLAAGKSGDRIGRYKLLEKIGEGGFGEVWMAEQEEPVRRRVALKIIKLGMDTKEVVLRFEAERQALALMEHPNIARVFDGGSETGRPYFVMELVRGIPITGYCDESQLPTRDRLQLFIKVCQAVQHAHQKGIIHRDIKPSNVLVTLHDGEPVPKVIDFGVAKALGQRLTQKTLFTGFAQMIGTPAYMSPEQAELSGLDIDTRSDIYSLGVLLYELLTGVTPFDRETFAKAALDEIRRMIRETEPPKPSTRLRTLGDKLPEVAKHRCTEPMTLSRLVRGDLDWIVLKCLEKDRTRRYDTASDLVLDVQRHLSDEPVSARAPSKLYRFQKLVRRNRLAFCAAGAVMIALLGGLGLSIWFFLKESAAHKRAVAAERTQAGLRQQAEDAKHAETVHRLEAESAGRNARAQAARAEAAATQVKLTLASSDFLQALRLIDENNCSEALAYLARSLSANPTNDAASMRLATLLVCHSWAICSLVVKSSGSVNWAQFSPDGKKIFTASNDGAVRVWDVQNGRLLSGAFINKEIHWSLQFRPDGKRLATASEDFTVRIWDTQTGMPLTRPLEHKGQVNSVEFSLDGKHIVTASSDGTARVWDAETGQPLTEPLKHKDNVNSAQFNSDGKRIVTASDDDTATVWDAETGQPLIGPLKHKWRVLSAWFSPNGKRIVTASNDGRAQLWDAQNGNALPKPLMHDNRVRSVSFSPDGNRIVTASDDHTAQVWDVESGQPLAQPLRHTSQVMSTEFSPDGRRIVTASTDGTARVWDVESGRPLTEPLKHDGPVWAARFSPEGARIVTGSGDRTARVWDLRRREQLPMPLDHLNPVSPPEFSPNGEQILSAPGGVAARVWDARSGLPVTKPLKHNAEVRSAHFSPDGKQVLTASEDGTARAWDAHTGEPLTEPLKHEGVVSSAQFSPDGKRIVTTSYDGTTRIWDARSGQALITPIKHNGPGWSAQFSPDGRRIVTVNLATAQVWNSENGQPVTGPFSPASATWSAQFSPDSRLIVTASLDGTARVWDALNGQPLTEPLRHLGRVTSAVFGPDGKLIATGSDDEAARIWDVGTGQMLTKPLKHSGPVSSAQFSPDGKLIVTASSDHTARVWSTRSGQAVTDPLKHNGPVSSAQFSPDGRRILVDAGDGTARVWDVGLAKACPQWFIPLSEAISGEVLSNEGILERTRAPNDTINLIRERLRHEPDEDDWVVWGRWFLADPNERTISPFCTMTLSQYIECDIRQNTAQSLDEAEKLAVGDADQMQRVLQARSKFENTKR